MSARSLAGSRANKRRPIARQTLPSDRTPATKAHYLLAGWVGGPGGCGVECICGVTFDGFERLGEATEILDGHIAARRKPHHAVRRLDIGIAFPPAPGVRPSLGAVAGAKGCSAEPMSYNRRFLTYCRQTRSCITDRQQRQINRQARRTGDESLGGAR